MEEAFPIISAIVPVFNKGTYLVDAIESLRQQKYANMEVIVVDDGSTDDSPQVISGLPAQFPELNIATFRKTNGGASDARNFAVKHARGLFMVNMDADDIMVPGFLHEALTIISSDGADVVYSDLELFGDRTGEWIPNPYDPYFIRYDNCVPALAVYRRELWEKVGGYNVSMPFNEDWNFFVAMTRFNARFRKVPRKAFRYRQTGTGLYHSFIREAWEWGVCMLMCAQDDLYGIDEVLASCQKLQGMPERWILKFKNQLALHPTEWLPSLWLGFVAEGKGDVAEALRLFQQACSVSRFTAWLPLYKLGMLAEQFDINTSIQAFHQVRILRPEMGRIINARIEELHRRSLSQRVNA